jgi:ABC-type multidrug transport system ATPase subunit
MLAIHKLTKIYPGSGEGGGVQALTDVDLEVDRGMFGLLGPNGAGKTTLMRIISGLLEPTSGTVTLDGEDIVADPRRVRRRLGYLPQEFGFYPHLTGEKMLAHLLRLKGVTAPGRKPAELVAELLARVNLTAAAGQKVSAWSGGMRQRLGVSQAIAGDPRLIIVDEPTAGLDPEERLRFYRLLAELAEDRIVLLSTHIVEDVAVLCARFAIIRQGRLVTCTTPAEARRRIAGRVFEAVVSRHDLDELRARHRVIQSVLVEGEIRARVHQSSGEPPPGFRPVPETLEDAYLITMQEAEEVEELTQTPAPRPEVEMAGAVRGAA